MAAAARASGQAATGLQSTCLMAAVQGPEGLVVGLVVVGAFHNRTMGYESSACAHALSLVQPCRLQCLATALAVSEVLIGRCASSSPLMYIDVGGQWNPPKGTSSRGLRASSCRATTTCHMASAQGPASQAGRASLLKHNLGHTGLREQRMRTCMRARDGCKVSAVGLAVLGYRFQGLKTCQVVCHAIHAVSMYATLDSCR